MKLLLKHLLSITLLAGFSLAVHSQSIPISPMNAQFEYDLKISADPTKRATYLKQSGEAPSPYEQAYGLIKGSVSVATVVDKVDIRKDQFHRNSGHSTVYSIARSKIGS